MMPQYSKILETRPKANEKIIVIATGGTIAGSGEDGRTTEYRAVRLTSAIFWRPFLKLIVWLKLKWFRSFRSIQTK